MRRIAIIGGGIAGFSCAWALHRAGLEPTVYEREADVGGNAKTFRWSTPGGEVTTGLSVLAWPEAYFHNYGCLLRALDVAIEPTPRLRFFVRDGHEVFAHGLDSRGREKYAPDLARWDRLIARIRRLNAFFAGSPEKTLYEMSPLNPLHLVRLRDAARAAGISRAFWERVFVPIHSSSFLSSELDVVPASIAPILEDIVSLSEGGSLMTWSRSSRDVFTRMARGFEARTYRDRRVVEVVRSSDEVEVADANGARARYDAVVFACNAHDALAALDAGGGARASERAILGGIRYADELDAMFARGTIHSDSGVLPAEYKDEILRSYANYVDCIEDGGGLRYENTFVLSSWVPAARGSSLPMMVSYNRRGPIEDAAGKVENTRAHPSLSSNNLARAALIRTLQGRRRTHYCGSFTTPGNGHDLSLLSGLVAADALGAAYPFEGHEAARRDFLRLKRFMLGR